VPFDIGLDRSTKRSCGARRMAESAALLVDAVTVSFRVAETLVPTGVISEAFRGDTLVILVAKIGVIEIEPSANSVEGICVSGC
jgi:hypothetical protein